MDRPAILLENSGAHVRCAIEAQDSRLWGKRAELRILRKVVVKDSRPIHHESIIFRRKIPSLRLLNEVAIPRPALRGVYSYDGEQIQIEIHVQLSVERRLIADALFTHQIELELGIAKPAVAPDSKKVVDPHDAFEILANFLAIAPKSKVKAGLLLFAAGIVMAVNLFIGVHDQRVPNPKTYCYKHTRKSSPLELSLATTSLLGMGVWALLRKQLRDYMTFHLAPLPSRIGAGDVIPMNQLVRGRPRVDLFDVTVRVVACNLEKGQYKRQSGKSQRVISFAVPVTPVVLYEKRIAGIPHGARVESYLDGEVRFAEMFRNLRPPQIASKTHGLAVHWEVQLLHEEFVDYELICPLEPLSVADFEGA